jgi:3-dehydroquinate synthase
MKANLPTSINKGINSEKLIQAMSVDKKVVDGNIRLVLLNSVGDSFVTGSYSKENFQKVVSNFCQ